MPIDELVFHPEIQNVIVYFKDKLIFRGFAVTAWYYG